MVRICGRLLQHLLKCTFRSRAKSAATVTPHGADDEISKNQLLHIVLLLFTLNFLPLIHRKKCLLGLPVKCLKGKHVVAYRLFAEKQSLDVVEVRSRKIRK